MEFVVCDEILAKVQHVVLDFCCPVVPYCIFGADAEHPSAERLVRRNQGTYAASDRTHGGRGIDTDMGPGTAQLAVDKRTIEGPPDPCSQGGNPVEPCFRARRANCEPGKDKACRSGVFYACRRHLPFNTKHPLACLVIEAGLTAAENATSAASPTAADMTADVKAGPVINHGHNRCDPVGGSWHRIGGSGHHCRQYQRRCNKAEPVSAHDICPPM